MSFDRATFYATLRRGTLFDHGLSQRQVTGTEAILDAWDKSGFTDERWLALLAGRFSPGKFLGVGAIRRRDQLRRLQLWNSDLAQAAQAGVQSGLRFNPATGSVE